MSRPLFFAVALVSTINAATAFAHPRAQRNYNHNRDEVINGNVDKQFLVLTGRVGRLIIRGKVDGQSILDLGGLAAREVIIDDKIDGQSTVIIGSVELVRIGGKIDGQSKLTVQRCKDFIVGGTIVGGRNGVSPGQATEIDVNFTRNRRTGGGNDFIDGIHHVR